LEQEWQRALRHNAPLSFMMMDIDKFKPYNDTYGHLQGDRALKAVAQAIKNSLPRGTDKCARWGGEEFAVILPDTDLNGAKGVAERIRVCVESLLLPLEDETITKVTISIGINSATPPLNDGYTLKQFVSHADAALYHAKQSGRNRYKTAEDLPEGNLA
jgi:diguanylate cyclase (GGDEF)-like protein